MTDNPCTPGATGSMIRDMSDPLARIPTRSPGPDVVPSREALEAAIRHLRVGHRHLTFEPLLAVAEWLEGLT